MFNFRDPAGDANWCGYRCFSGCLCVFARCTMRSESISLNGNAIARDTFRSISIFSSVDPLVAMINIIVAKSI